MKLLSKIWDNPWILKQILADFGVYLLMMAPGASFEGAGGAVAPPKEKEKGKKERKKKKKKKKKKGNYE